MTVIEVRDLIVNYGLGAERVSALRGVTAAFAPAQVACIMGPSGSGKSTLLSVLAGLRQPSSGEVWVCGRRLDTMTPALLAAARRESIGMVFQNFRLLQHLTVIDNLRVAAEIVGVPRARQVEVSQQALASVRLNDKARRRLSELSGGEKQRVAIARAMLGRPAVLLADEPTAALDTENGRRCFDLLRDQASTAGCAVVVVTHDARIAERSDVFWRMRDGTLTAGS